ncbi:WD domain, G-beta repeat protein [Trichuris suis]|nr:WD domain, G-beta repeat protein [Trichuris suis]
MRRFDSADPSLENYFVAHAGSVNSLSFSPNGKQLATVGKDGLLKVWNFKPHTRSYTYPDPKANVNCVRFSPNGLLLAYSANCDVIFRTPTVKSVCRSFRAHQATVQCLDFSLNAESLATSSNDKTVKVWRISDDVEQFAYSLKGHHNWVRWVSKTCIHTFHESHSAVLCVEFHPQGFYVAACGVDKPVHLWDLRMLRLIQVYNEHTDAVTAADFHPSGFFLSTCSMDNTVKLYDLTTGRVLYTLHGHSTGVTCGQFSKQGDHLCSGDMKGKVLLWRTNLVANETGVASPAELPLADRLCFNTPLIKSGAWTELHPLPSSPTKVNAVHDEQSPRVGLTYTTDEKSHARCPCAHTCATPQPTDEIRETLTDITQQLTLLTETVSLLEKRLSRAEKKIQDVLERGKSSTTTLQNVKSNPPA